MFWRTILYDKICLFILVFRICLIYILYLIIYLSPILVGETIITDANKLGFYIEYDSAILNYNW